MRCAQGGDYPFNCSTHSIGLCPKRHLWKPAVFNGSLLSLTNSVAPLPATDNMASTLVFLSGLEEPTLESDPDPSGKRRRGRGSSLLHDTKADPLVVIHS